QFYRHGALRNDSQSEHVSSRKNKTESGMLVDLRGRGGRRDRILFTWQATLLTLIILLTTASCSRPDMPQPLIGIFERGPFGIFEREPSPPGRVTDAAKRQLVQRDKGQSQVRREQPRTSASPKVA